MRAVLNTFSVLTRLTGSHNIAQDYTWHHWGLTKTIIKSLSPFIGWFQCKTLAVSAICIPSRKAKPLIDLCCFCLSFNKLSTLLANEWLNNVSLFLKSRNDSALTVLYTCCVFLFSSYSQRLRGSGSVLFCGEFSSFHTQTHAHTHTHARSCVWPRARPLTQQDVV